MRSDRSGLDWAYLRSGEEGLSRKVALHGGERPPLNSSFR